jgi:hypothetical protein
VFFLVAVLISKFSAITGNPSSFISKANISCSMPLQYCGSTIEILSSPSALVIDKTVSALFIKSPDLYPTPEDFWNLILDD